MLARSRRDAHRAARLKQSVSRWCYGRIPLDDLCEAAKAIGYKSVELLERRPTGRSPKKHGLECAMANGFGTIPVGFNRPDNHDKLVADAERMIPLAAAAGVPNIVVFSGNRAGHVRRRRNRELHRRTQARHADGRAARRDAVSRDAEQQGRSQGLPGRSHRVGACRSCRASRRRASSCCTTSTTCRSWKATSSRRSAPTSQHIAHFHTGGVPGRAEIDDTQELNYRRVMQAIADTGVHGIRRRRSSCRSAIRSRRSSRRSRSATSRCWIAGQELGSNWGQTPFRANGVRLQFRGNGSRPPALSPKFANGV